MSKITVVYNGDINLPLDRNHITICGNDQLSREFNSVDEAIMFQIECSFYSGSISTLDEIIPKGYESQLLKILNEKPLTVEEVIIKDSELNKIPEEEGLNSIL